MVNRLMFFCFWLLAANGCVLAGPLLDYQRALVGSSHYSLSRQFVIHDLPPGTLPAYLPNETNLVELDPTLLAVSCERIKNCLLTQLGQRDEHRGKIYIVLRRTETTDEPIAVTPAYFGGEWDYQLDMPDHVERSRLISAIVEVLLLEMADRNAERSTEIPAWLSQGMSREVMFASEEDLVIEKPHHFENGLNLNRLTRTNMVDNPLIQAHADLQAMPPLSLVELSWPKPGQFDGASGEAYRSSAQLFVHELLQLKDGRECFKAFLSELPKHLNWQIAFLRGFHSHFGTQLELEKWWALRVVQFTGRDLAQTWRADESWQKLYEIVHPFVEVRVDAKQMPVHSQVALQAIVRDWDMPHQITLFRERSQQLLLLRMRVSQDLIYLVDDYRRTLDAYAKKRESSGVNQIGKNLYVPALDDFGRDTIRTLDVLEARLQQLRPNPQNVPAITANVRSNN